VVVLVSVYEFEALRLPKLKLVGEMLKLKLGATNCPFDERVTVLPALS